MPGKKKAFSHLDLKIFEGRVVQRSFKDKILSDCSQIEIMDAKTLTFPSLRLAKRAVNFCDS